MRPIPTIEDPERYTDSAFVDSAFIELKSCDLWDVKMLYPILHMDHAEENCFVRKEMYERLVKAAGNLPDGYRFRIWDAWRPFALQHELFEKYSVDIIRDFHLEELPEAKRRAAICKFVSDPVPDTKVPPAHTTGGAIDLTILDLEAESFPWDVDSMLLRIRPTRRIMRPRSMYRGQRTNRSVKTAVCFIML